MTNPTFLLWSNLKLSDWITSRPVKIFAYKEDKKNKMLIARTAIFIFQQLINEGNMLDEKLL